LDDRRRVGGTNFILRIKEQETRLTRQEHDDDDDDYDICAIISPHQINTDRCIHILLNRHFIKNICNCNLFRPLKVSSSGSIVNKIIVLKFNLVCSVCCGYVAAATVHVILKGSKHVAVTYSVSKVVT